MIFYFTEINSTVLTMLNALQDAGLNFGVRFDSDSECMVLEISESVKTPPQRKIFVEPNPYPHTFPQISWGESNTPAKFTYTINPSSAKFTLDDQ